MENKILIISEKKTNILDSIIYKLDQEMIEYEVKNKLINENLEDISHIIYVNYNKEELILDFEIPLIIISESKMIIEKDNTVNYIITPLVNDDVEYTSVQQEYLYKKGIYSILNEKVYEFIINDNNINGLIVDISNCKTGLKDWVFKFDSIADTYAWLTKRNSNSESVEKIINFYHPKIYNDSSKEINYLTDKLKNIQSGYRCIDIFICTKDELEEFKRNHFFKLIIKNITDTHPVYIIDRDILKEKESNIYNKLLDGILIYEDCVYRDTYDDEYSLGIVDCKEGTIKMYNEYYDYIIEKYGYRLYTEDDANGI